MSCGVSADAEKLRVLWILGESPLPADSGAKLRVLNLLTILASRHRITAAVLSPDGGPMDSLRELRARCGDVLVLPWRGRARGWRLLASAVRNLGSRLPLGVPDYAVEAERMLSGLAGESFDLIQCENIGFHRYLAKPFRGASVLATHNVEADILHQRARLTKHPVLRAYIRMQARRMARYERWLAARYHAVTAVSEEDAAAFRDRYGAPQVSVVPNGVDTARFAPGGDGPEPGLVVFTGAMDYAPNDDAMHFFLRAVWPSIAQQDPRARLDIVGRAPGVSLRALASRSPRVRVTGWVEDVRPYLGRASVVVVPLRMGGGSRLKILEAMAMGKPVVSTPVGAEGLRVHSPDHLLITGDEGEMAGRVADLLRDPGAAEGLGRAAREFVVTQYDWKVCAGRLHDAWMGICGRRTGRTRAGTAVSSE